jgi:hypothetical protein
VGPVSHGSKPPAAQSTRRADGQEAGQVGEHTQRGFGLAVFEALLTGQFVSGVLAANLNDNSGLNCAP